MQNKNLFSIEDNINNYLVIKSNKQYGIVSIIFIIIEFLVIMSIEAGSKECRNLIEAKESLLSALESLSGISSSEELQMQIKDIYNTLETIHDNRRKIESAANA